MDTDRPLQERAAWSAADRDAFVAAGFADHAALVAKTAEAVSAPLGRLIEIARACVAGGGKVMFFGNGGSAADAQHLATELAVRYSRDRPPIAALVLTAAGNDYGFDAVFARQIEALGRPGDLAIGISTSGRSGNVTRGLEMARRLGLTAAAFAGRDGGDLAGLADPILIVPSRETDRIQEMHIAMGHIFCAGLERALGLV